MRARSAIVLVAVLVTAAACGDDDDGGSPSNSTASSSDTSPSGGETPSAGVTGAPNTATFAPPVDVAALLQPDAATALAELGFPEGWVLPEGGADAITGVLVRYSQGDSLYSSFRTAYSVPEGDLETVGEQWVTAFDESLGITVPLMAANITSENGESVFYTSSGDAEPGAPSLEIEVIRATDTPDALTVVADYQTVDRTMPALTFPADVDAGLPATDACTVRRYEADLNAFIQVNMPAEAPTYTIWWEGDCPDATFDEALAWAASHGEDMGEGTTGFTRPVTLDDGTVVDMSANQLDDGGTFLTMIVEQPVDSGA
jgi:hypothetical protein